MTILFLSPSFYPRIGGVEKHAFEVAKILSKKHRVVVLTEDSKNTHETLKGIEIYRFNFGKNNWFKKFRIWKKLLSKRKLFQRADIIHCHDVFFWYFPLRFLFPNKKVFTTFHGYETVYPPKFKAILIRRLSERLSNGNICVGDYIKKWYGTSPTYVTYGAVSGIKNLKFKVKNYNSKLKILFIGRLAEDTGCDIFLKALESLKNKQLKFDLILAGDGLYKTKFEQFGKVLGFVKNPNKYIKTADIIFASSYLSILSSISMKKAVFSVYQNPLKRDYLKMGPFSKLINIYSSSEDLVKGVSLYWKKPKTFEEKVEKGYNYAKAQSWKRVASIYYSLYHI